MKKIVSLLFIVILCLSFCGKKEKKEQVQERKPILVKASEIHKGALVKVLNYKGTTQAWKTANIVPDVSGRVGRIFKKQGDRVKKNEILAELDLTNMALQQKQARAAFAVAESAYRDAQLTYERMKKMIENKAVSQMQYEKAQLGLDAADTQLKSARANLDLVDYALKNSSMRAPFDGVVAAKNMEEGDMINPMMGMGTSVLTVLDLSRIKVVVDVAGEDIERVNVGQSCQVRVSSLPGQFFPGTVFSKNLAADPSSKSFKVEIGVDNPLMKIKSGLFADIFIEIYRNENALLVPLSALIGSNQVMVYENGVAKKRTIRTGQRNETHIELVGGIQEGERVIIEGNYDLKDNSLVTIAGDKK